MVQRQQTSDQNPVHDALDLDHETGPEIEYAPVVAAPGRRWKEVRKRISPLHHSLLPPLPPRRCRRRTEGHDRSLVRMLGSPWEV